MALILGDDELDQGRVGVKPLRRDAPQEPVALDQAPAYLARLVAGPHKPGE